MDGDIDFTKYFNSEDMQQPAPGKLDSSLQVVGSDSMEAAHNRLISILDKSALDGVSDEDSNALIAAAGHVREYQLIDLVRQSDDTVKDAPGLTTEQTLYLYLLDSNFTPAIICNILNIKSSLPRIWTKQCALYAACNKMIIESMVDQAENKSIRMAIDKDGAAIERMFVIKGHKPQYRDNAPVAGAANIVLDITIDHKSIDMSENYLVQDDDIIQEDE